MLSWQVARSRRAGRRHAVSGVAFLLPAAVHAAPGAARGEILWRGGFETGTFSEWDALQAVPGGARVVSALCTTAPTRPASRSGRGGNPLPCACGERAELVERTNEKPGTVSTWAWSVYFPAEFAVKPGGRIVFTQWHDYEQGLPGHPAPVVLRVLSVGGQERFSLGVRGGRAANPTGRDWTLDRVQRGHWYDLVAQIPWASDGSGYVQLMIDGTWVVPRTSTPTLFVENAAKGVYLKQGLYRAAAWSGTSVAYLDATRRGRTLSDVLPTG